MSARCRPVPTRPDSLILLRSHTDLYAIHPFFRPKSAFQFQILKLESSLFVERAPNGAFYPENVVSYPLIRDPLFLFDTTMCHQFVLYRAHLDDYKNTYA